MIKFTFRDKSTNHDVFKINENNAVSLYYQNNAKLSTTSTGAQIDTILRLYGAAGNPGKLLLSEGGATSDIRVERSTDTSVRYYSVQRLVELQITSEERLILLDTLYLLLIVTMT